MKHKRKVDNIPVFIPVSCALLFAGLAVLSFLWPIIDAGRRQETEESLVQAFLESVESTGASISESTEEETGTCQGESTGIRPQADRSVPDADAAADTDGAAFSENCPESFSFEDEVYYTRGSTVFTPDYASGTLLGVLEIESCEIRRGVYGGTWTDIQHDLDIWMVTAARPDYVLNKTHFVIYGHNHPVQNLSFNRLKDLQIGQTFTFTTESCVYEYEVINFMADQREKITEEIADNFDLPSDQMYIITCGRGEYACRDIVYVGKLRRRTDLNAYAEDREN